MRFSPPMLSFDLRSSWIVLRNLGDVVHMMEFDPGHFVNASRALGVLGFFVAQVKVVVSGVTYFRTKIASASAASVPFWKAAGLRLCCKDFPEQFIKSLQEDDATEHGKSKDQHETGCKSSDSQHQPSALAGSGEQSNQHPEAAAAEIEHTGQLFHVAIGSELH